jgi:hydroxymethylbilane synthase
MTIIAAPAVRIGTRGSALAMIQARIVAERLRLSGAKVRIETIVTQGDRRAPGTPWGEGAFVTAIETALVEGVVDIAVHSAKDLPTDEDRRLTIAAFLPRESPEDALVLAAGRRLGSLDELPARVRVGTDSPRRTAFLRSLRPDLVVHAIHGNVDTRLRRLDSGETDALVLAVAGLRRLGLEDRISLVLPTSVVPPAPGQGALAVQVRASDRVTRDLVARLDDPATRRAVEAERSLLAASGGGCRAPLGACATMVGGRLEIQAGFATPDGRIAVHSRRRGEASPDGSLVTGTLVDLADRAARAAAELGAPRIVVTGPASGAATTTLALVDRGLAPVGVPCIATFPADSPVADQLVERLSSAHWVVVTSPAAVDALMAAAERTGRGLAAPGRGASWAAVGPGTARALRVAGVSVAFVPSRSTGVALAETLPLVPGQRVLLPRGDLADAAVPTRLAERGAVVEPLVVYRTVEAPVTSRDLIRAALADAPSAAVMTSASTVRGWLRLAKDVGILAAARSVPVVAIGPSTAAEARGYGLRVIAEAASPALAALADLAARAIQTLQETP